MAGLGTKPRTTHSSLPGAVSQQAGGTSSTDRRMTPTAAYSSSLGCVPSAGSKTDSPALSRLTRLQWEFEAGHCRTRGLSDETINQALSLLAEFGITQRHCPSPRIDQNLSAGPQQPDGPSQVSPGVSHVPDPYKGDRSFLPFPLTRTPVPPRSGPFFPLVLIKSVGWTHQGRLSDA